LLMRPSSRGASRNGGILPPSDSAASCRRCGVAVRPRYFTETHQRAVNRSVCSLLCGFEFCSSSYHITEQL
jgi:hypothetical protein